MKISATLSVILGVIMVGYCHCAVVEPKFKQLVTKVFNYQGDLPIKDDRTGEIINGVANNTQSQADMESICWNLIVDQTVLTKWVNLHNKAVTFALQDKVLNELEKELKSLPLDAKLSDVIAKMIGKLRGDMQDATEALKDESSESYFDALFATSEDIIAMSSLIRDPNLNDGVFMALVKAVSRLGRNNSTLIQDFIDQCSVIEKSPRPRSLVRA